MPSNPYFSLSNHLPYPLIAFDFLFESIYESTDSAHVDTKSAVPQNNYISTKQSPRPCRIEEGLD